MPSKAVSKAARTAAAARTRPSKGGCGGRARHQRLAPAVPHQADEEARDDVERADDVDDDVDDDDDDNDDDDGDDDVGTRDRASRLVLAASALSLAAAAALFVGVQ